MKTTTFGNHMAQLTRFTAFNCFLVREEDGFTLIDTGLTGSEKSIIQAAHELGAPIRRIVLTHAHSDHVGSLDALHELLPDAEVAISARDARFLTGDHSLDPDEPQLPLKGGYPIVKTTPTRLLQPTDRIGSLEAIGSPGHTPGHMAYLDHRDGTIFAGDTYSTKAGIVTGGSLRLLFPFHALATWDKAMTLHSAEILRDLKPARLAVGHGKTLDDPISEMERAIAEAKHHLGNEDYVRQEAY